jgi:hypothetical protein
MKLRLLASILSTAIGLAHGLSAQTTTSGGLTGVVTDRSGAVLPNSDVEIRDNSKGTAQSLKPIAKASIDSSFLLPLGTC